MGTQGFTTTTYRFKVYRKHFDWIAGTKEKYNQVLEFYYHLLSDKKDWLSLSNQTLLRQLEIVTIGEKRKGLKPENPLPVEKTPLYFRRAAINAAISMVRSLESGEESDRRLPAARFQASPLFYKGMYKEFTADSILLKLWTGRSWSWVRFRLQSTGRRLPEQAKLLSPSIKIKGDSVFLHAPVEEPVDDVRKVKERVEQKEKICSVYFPNGKSLAACAVFDNDGRFEHAYFIRGGAEFKHRRKYYQRIMERNRRKAGGCIEREKEGIKLHNIADYYAHKASREIINYCKSHGVKILAVPHYRDRIPAGAMGFLQGTGYDWIGRRIIRYLKYKAFQEGIVLTKVNPHYVVSRCYQCQEPISRYNEGSRPNRNFYGGRLYACPNHHKGNTAYNAARNIGRRFYDKYAEKTAS